MIAFGTMLNYLDRTVLGIAAPSLTRDLHLTAAMMGIAFSAFSWSYALLQIPGGIALDRFGTRTTYFVALFCWSAFTAAMGTVRSLTGLVLTRIGVGTFEAPCFPANSRILASWFPQQERARANAIYSVGQYAAVLDHATIRMAWPVSHRRRHRGAVRVPLAGGLPRPFSESPRQSRGIALHRGGRRR
jgi:ACS family D-galactonate transporter-like MFS transporter